MKKYDKLNRISLFDGLLKKIYWGIKRFNTIFFIPVQLLWIFCDKTFWHISSWTGIWTFIGALWWLIPCSNCNVFIGKEYTNLFYNLLSSRNSYFSFHKISLNLKDIINRNLYFLSLGCPALWENRKIQTARSSLSHTFESNFPKFIKFFHA